MATKEARISIRPPTDLDAWVEGQAGGKRGKPAYIRRLLERERDLAEEAEMQDMFDRAWESLSKAERDRMPPRPFAAVSGAVRRSCWYHREPAAGSPPTTPAYSAS